MKRIVLAFCLCLPLLLPAATELKVWPQSKPQADRMKLSGTWERETPSGKYILKINSTSVDGSIATIPLDLKRYKGSVLQLTVELKAVGVTKPNIPWLGIKFMLPYKGNGTQNWPSATDGLYGDIDWKSFTLTMHIPNDIQDAELWLGIQGATGEVMFRNLQVKILSRDELCPPPFVLPANFKCEYSPEIAARPAARGVMSPPPHDIQLKDLEDLASWGANLIRWQFLAGQAGDLKNYNLQLDRGLDKLVSLAPDLKRLGIKVVFDMHSPPGGRYSEPAVLGTAGTLAQLDGSTCFRLFMEDVYFNAFIDSWRKIATRLKGTGIIWGYDLLNEPTDGGQSVKYDYLKAQYEAARAIREVDPETPIIVEADNWSNPSGFSYLKPLPLKNIIYTFHFYIPGEYTHQGTSAATKEALLKGQKLCTYPGIISGIMTDREALKKAMDPVAKFQSQYGAQIYCGEFSVIRWAPGAEQWLKDVLSLLEEKQWSWTYHAYREWDGWSVEHDENIRNENRVNYDTARKKLLLKQFEKNKK